MKSQRQAKIMEIITNRNVETQEQLLQELRSAGFHSTQATISRDIKELRIVKELTSFGTDRYAVSEDNVTTTFSGRQRMHPFRISPYSSIVRVRNFPSL